MQKIVYRIGGLFTSYPDCYTREEDFPKEDFQIGDITENKWIITEINNKFNVIILNKLVYGDFYFLSIDIYDEHRELFKNWGQEKFDGQICEKVEYIKLNI